jgi:tRNA-binding EMAP/Myf-like protein
MILSRSTKFNVNYATRFVKIDNVRKHNNADRLQIVTIDGNNCIVDLSVKVGDTMLFCVAGTAINKDFCKVNNLYEDKTLNADLEQKGYLNKHGRIKALNLRGENSAGLLLSMQSLFLFFKSGTIDIKDVGVDFDTIDNVLFSWKYIPPFIVEQGTSTSGNKRNRKLKRFDRLIEEQFKFHIDTAQFGKNLHKFELDDLIHVSAKWHGTSWIVGKVLINKQLKWYEKLAIKLGLNIITTEYGDIYASRSVIKNQYINREQGPSYYKTNVWERINTMIQPFLAYGLTIYGEAVGYEPETTKFIQKGYDYGCSPGIMKIVVYRITCTTPLGKIYEFSARQVQQWCKACGLEAVHEGYYGTVYNMLVEYNIDPYAEDWREQWYQALSNDKNLWMELNDPCCKEKVPFEGIVIRKEIFGIESYKLKCQRFLQRESKALDNNEEDMESEN